MKKRGPKGKAPGKAMSPGKLQKLRALEEAHWKRKIPKLIASLALERGESMDAGEARMALYTTLQVIDEAPDLKFDGSGDKVQGLHACFERAAELTGSSPLTLKRLFWSHFKTDGDTYEIADTSKRGNGSDSVDKATLYKVKPEQSAAISAFIKFSNSSQGSAKVITEQLSPPCPHPEPNVALSHIPRPPPPYSPTPAPPQVTLDEIGKYMEFGPDEGSSAPALPEARAQSRDGFDWEVGGPGWGRELDEHSRKLLQYRRHGCG